MFRATNTFAACIANSVVQQSITNYNIELVTNYNIELVTNYNIELKLLAFSWPPLTQFNEDDL